MDVRRRIEVVGYHIERLGELVEELEQEDEEKIMIELGGGMFGGVFYSWELHTRKG